jgi:hypothetical protein
MSTILIQSPHSGLKLRIITLESIDESKVYVSHRLDLFFEPLPFADFIDDETQCEVHSFRRRYLDMSGGVVASIFVNAGAYSAQLTEYIQEKIYEFEQTYAGF